MKCPHCNHEIPESTINSYFAKMGGKAGKGVPRNRKRCDCGALLRKDGGCTRCEKKASRGDPDNAR